MLRELDEEIRKAATAHIAKSAKSYQRAWRYWIIFVLFVACMPPTMIFRVYEDRPNLKERLADETDLMRFSCWLKRRMRTVGAVASHVSMVRTMHRTFSGMDFAEGCKMHRLSAHLKGLGELYPSAPRDRHPATVSMFRKWTSKDWWYSKRFGHIAAAIELMFQALLRAAETVPRTASAFNPKVHLTWKCIKFVPPQGRPRYMEIAITPVKQANKSPNRHAARLPVVLPNANTTVSACRAVSYLHQRRRAELGGKDPPPDEPVLRDPKTGKPLAYAELLYWFRWLIDYVGDPSLVSKDFALHSLRIGGATALLKAGCPPAVIQALGRWSSEIYRLYTRACFEDGLKWAREMADTDVVPMEIPGLLERNGIDTEGDGSSALEREEGDWAEDGPDD
jgi:hypothetical protein